MTLSPWHRFGIWKDVCREEFEDSGWQDKHAVIRIAQLEAVLGQQISPDSLHDIETGLLKVGMSIRLNPYTISLIDWSNVEVDPIRRQFLPLASELEDDHPCLVIDSLEESSQSPVQGLVHRYPDKALFLVTSVCPVYCQYCTRSYAVGMDTQLIQKEHVTSAKNWAAALDYIRSNPEIEDIVVSGGDVSRLKAA
ncbi:MAG: KamA family radical SAM protein, partial [Roseiarcus sp.]